MKRLTPLLCLLFVPFLLPAPTTADARAEELRYAVAADSNVWFYSAENDDSRLFLIPETYYVRILYEGETFSAVEYLVNEAPYEKVVGYCRTQALTFVNFIPARPYLKKLITVSYINPDGDTGDFDDVFGSPERTFVYYGMRYDKGRLYFYVLSEGKFGYIPAETELEFERNDDYLNVPSGPAEADPQGGTEQGGMSVAQIVVLCLACAAAVVIAVFVLRGKRPAPPPDTPEF